MNLLKHAQRTVKQELCESGSFDQFSGSISLLNNFVANRMYHNRVDYKWYIHSELWKHRRQLYMEYYGAVCQHCRKAKVTGLALHHETYVRLGKEALDDLHLICRECHFKTHNKAHLRDLGLEV